MVAYQRDLTRPAPPVRCDLPFELRRVPDETLRRFKEMPPPFPRHHEYWTDYRLRRCYGAFVGNRIGALMWPHFRADNERRVSKWRQLLADEVQLGNLWADPGFRGRGLIDACMEAFVAYVAARGFRYLYEFAWVGNESANRLYRRRGFREVGLVRRYTLGWQRAGAGLYVRQRIPRQPLAPSHPGGDLELPEVLPWP
jgi:ribosomal protein S18 acetylase RimI-like enzyme